MEIKIIFKEMIREWYTDNKLTASKYINMPIKTEVILMNENIINLVVAILAVALGFIIRELNKLKQDLSDVKSSLDKVAKQVGVVDMPIKDMSIEELNLELKELILKNKRIEAIKTYKIATGKDLKEAKDYINNLK